MTFGHVIPLALVLASCDADSIVDGSTAFFGQDHSLGQDD